VREGVREEDGVKLGVSEAVRDRDIEDVVEAPIVADADAESVADAVADADCVVVADGEGEPELDGVVLRELVADVVDVRVLDGVVVGVAVEDDVCDGDGVGASHAGLNGAKAIPRSTAPDGAAKTTVFSVVVVS